MVSVWGTISTDISQMYFSNQNNYFYLLPHKRTLSLPYTGSINYLQASYVEFQIIFPLSMICFCETVQLHWLLNRQIFLGKVPEWKFLSDHQHEKPEEIGRGRNNRRHTEKEGRTQGCTSCFRILLRRGDVIVCSSIHVFNKLLLNVNAWFIILYPSSYPKECLCLWYKLGPQ